MLMTQDGAVLFGELLIQAVASGPTGMLRSSLHEKDR